MGNALLPTDRFTISPSVRTRTLDDELILLDLRHGEYFSLNTAGAAVWHALERGMDLAGIEQDVASTWPVDPSERWGMLAAIVTDLHSRSLIVPVA